MSNLLEFMEQYDKWQKNCLAEYNDKYGERRIYYKYPDDDSDYIPEQLVEFSSEGDAYPHGVFGIGHICHAVTSWQDSEHFVH